MDNSEWQSRVRDFVDGHDATMPFLPFTHVTTLADFRDIIDGDELKPQLCGVFNKRLVYFFYGRPAYRASQSSTIDFKWQSPIALIFKPETDIKIARVFPFDTGAFSRKMYGTVFAQRSELSWFELGNKIESAAKLVSAFYDGNKEYYYGKSDKEIDLDENMDFELQGIRYLASRQGQQIPNSNMPVDERASAAEIQTLSAVHLKDNLLHIIVPGSLLSNPVFLSATKRWGIGSNGISHYDEISGPGSEFWVGQIYRIVTEIYKKAGLI